MELMHILFFQDHAFACIGAGTVAVPCMNQSTFSSSSVQVPSIDAQARGHRHFWYTWWGKFSVDVGAAGAGAGAGIGGHKDGLRIGVIEDIHNI